jgi:hypothetical protein
MHCPFFMAGAAPVVVGVAPRPFVTLSSPRSTYMHALREFCEPILM